MLKQDARLLEPHSLRCSYMAAYPGYYLTGDVACKDKDGYVSVMARMDDVNL
jgi:propionyl-CoA synthetase